MSIERFNSEKDALIENYGLAVYTAQLFERGLQNVLTGLERLGVFTLPAEIDRSRDGFVDECLGPMLRVLESQAQMDYQTSRILKKANYQRNELIHRFLVENAIDLLNPVGRASINDKLRRIYKNISHAHWIVSQLAQKIFAELGVTPEYVKKHVAELGRVSRGMNEDGIDAAT